MVFMVLMVSGHMPGVIFVTRGGLYPAARVALHHHPDRGDLAAVPGWNEWIDLPVEYAGA